MDRSNSLSEVWVGNRIRYARMDQKVSQKRLSELTGISVKRISDIENSIDYYRHDLVEKLCEALDVEYGDGR